MIRPIWGIESMVLQEQSQIKTTQKQHAKRLTELHANSQTASKNKGVTGLKIELERQKLDQTGARNIRKSLRRISFSKR